LKANKTNTFTALIAMYATNEIKMKLIFAVNVINADRAINIFIAINVIVAFLGKEKISFIAINVRDAY